MSIDDELKRRFYLEMARIEHWDARALDEKIDDMLYERTTLSWKPEELIKLNKGDTKYQPTSAMH